MSEEFNILGLSLANLVSITLMLCFIAFMIDQAKKDKKENKK